MEEDNPSIISHISLGTNRFAEAARFYDAVLSALGCVRILEHPGAVAWGRKFPEFWLQSPIDGKAASVGNGSHVGFIARDPQAVRAFFAAALSHGGLAEGEPGPRPQYGPAYYGCFVRDLDGHKLEATFWDESLAEASS